MYEHGAPSARQGGCLSLLGLFRWQRVRFESFDELWSCISALMYNRFVQSRDSVTEVEEHLKFYHLNHASQQTPWRI